MAPSRLLTVGKLLIITAMIMFAGWVYYFVHLDRQIDFWDFTPAPVAIAVLLIGVRNFRSADRELRQRPTLFPK
jgi:hypothetical protein